MNGGPMVPAAFLELSRPQQAILLSGLGVLAAIIVIEPAWVGVDATLWGRAQLTFASAFAFVAALTSLPGTDGRIRRVRTWITVAIGLWLTAELIRNIEATTGYAGSAGPSDLVLIGILACAGVAYVHALRGQVEASDERALYLDAAVVFFTTAALMITVFGPVAVESHRGVIHLAHAIFFIATFGATLLLDVTVRAERRLHGAYVVLAGLLLLGIAFVWRLASPGAATMLDAGPTADLLAVGIVVTMLGTVTWTDRQDDSPAYTRLADRLRANLPLVALAATPLLLWAHATSEMAGFLADLDLLAIGLVLVSVAVRQSILLRDREAAVARERGMSRRLASTEGKYRALIERQPGIVYLAEPGEHGRWHYVSPQVESILGYSRQEWLDDPTLWARSIHPDDRERIVAAETSFQFDDDTTSQTWEYRLIAADGREVWVLDDETVTEWDDEGRPILAQGIIIDITERVLAEEAIRASEEQTRLIIDTASYPFVGMDAEGRIIDWNQRAVETFGWLRNEAIGQPLADLVIPPASREAHHRGLARYLATGEGPILSKRVEVTALHRDGREFPVDLTIWPVTAGGSVRFNALIDDITVRKRLESQLRHQALHDALTGLPNRVLFSDRLQHALDRADADPGLSLAVYFLDLDDFKNVNDSLGHTAGDRLLAAVADRLRASLRPEDTAARLGGDEFAVLIEGAMAADPSTIASRILDDLARPYDIDGRSVAIRASIGVSLSGPDGASPDELLRNADLAMYLAKARGKNRHELYTPGMHEQALRRHDLKSTLERALAAGELEVHYQPVVALADGRIVGVEALLRWRRGRDAADDTFVPLTELIPLAEETGLIIPIGRFVLERACKDLAAWQADRRTDPALTMAVNVSVVQLENGDLAADVDGALRRSGVDPGALVLELTESSLTNDSLDTVRTMRHLRARGVRIALDDFGTGYSSLARLRRFSVDVVKIDRSFVAAMGTERADLLVQSIIDLGRTLDMEVVAEGIERREQADALRRRGAIFGQGFYFSRPVPAAMLPSLLAGRRLPASQRRDASIASGA